MELDFWQQRWQEKQIGFHLDDVNPLLKKYWRELQLQTGSHVLVPLCGKALDLVWLEQCGHVVNGIECSPIAVQAFFAEQKLQAEVVKDSNIEIIHAGNIRLLQGDFFVVKTSSLASVSAVYDRAALIALPESMRKLYVNKLLELISSHAVMLLITLEYDQSQMSGPPFSVCEAEVRQLYDQVFQITKLQQSDVLLDHPQFARRGVSYLLETTYKLVPL